MRSNVTMRAFWGLLAAVVFAGGAGAGAFVVASASAHAPSSVVPSSPETVAVTSEEFADPQHAVLHAELSAGGDVRVHRDGVVTALNCASGVPWVSGEIVARVDGAPVIALATRTPLWRDLMAGARGADVTAVQGELARLGVAVPRTGVVDSATAVAIAAWLDRRGIASTAGAVLPMAAVAWLPQQKASVASCAVQAGQRVSDGEALATVAPRVVRFTLTPASGVLPGARAVTVDGAEVPVSDDLVIADRATVSELTGSPSVAAWLAGDDVPSGLPVTWQLAEPLAVASVPPAALIGLSAGSACLRDPSGGDVPVTVVSSILGRSLVRPESAEAPLPQHVVLDPTGAETCR